MHIYSYILLCMKTQGLISAISPEKFELTAAKVLNVVFYCRKICLCKVFPFILPNVHCWPSVANGVKADAAVIPKYSFTGLYPHIRYVPDWFWHQHICHSGTGLTRCRSVRHLKTLYKGEKDTYTLHFYTEKKLIGK